MAQIFHRSTNTISKVSLVCAVLGAGMLLAFAYSMDRGSYGKRGAFSRPLVKMTRAS